MSPNTEAGEMFINRRKFKSMNVLVASDWNKNLIHVYPIWPGAACDVTVWKHSPLYKLLQNDRDKIIPRTINNAMMT